MPSEPVEENPRALLRGLASGLLFLTLFGALWALAGMGLSGVEGGPRWIVLTVTLVATVILTYHGIRLAATAGRALAPTTANNRVYGREIGLQFGLVFGAEIVLIFVASNVLPAVGLDRLVVPAIAMIVGVDFVPLAGLFHVRLYYVTGGVLIGLALVGIVRVFTAEDSTIWHARVAYGAALTLWTTAALLARRGRRLLSAELSRS